MDSLKINDRPAAETESKAYVPPFQLTEGQPPPFAANGGWSYMSFDRNGDGKVSKSETPWTFRRYQFNGIDHNDDAELTREEIEQAARWRVR